MQKTKPKWIMFFVLVGLFYLGHGCLMSLGADAQYSPPQICYGQQKPICPLGAQVACVCTGEIGQNCQYICIAEAHDQR
jgi:hypothetical protein